MHSLIVYTAETIEYRPQHRQFAKSMCRSNGRARASDLSIDWVILTTKCVSVDTCADRGGTHGEARQRR